MATKKKLSTYSATDITTLSGIEDTYVPAFKASADNYKIPASSFFDTFYTKSDVYNKTEINELIADFGGYEVVGLTTGNYPAVDDPDTKTIYLTKDTTVTGDDKYKEWIWKAADPTATSAWDLIGDTTLDLANYTQTTDFTTAALGDNTISVDMAGTSFTAVTAIPQIPVIFDEPTENGPLSGITFGNNSPINTTYYIKGVPNNGQPYDYGMLPPMTNTASDVGKVLTVNSIGDLEYVSVTPGSVPGAIKIDNTDISCNIVHYVPSGTGWNALTDTGFYEVDQDDETSANGPPEAGKMPCLAVNTDNFVFQLTYGDDLFWRWRGADNTWNSWHKALTADKEVLVQKDDAAANYNEIMEIIGAGLSPVVYEEIAGTADNIIAYYHLVQQDDCKLFFDSTSNNTRLKLTWHTDPDTHITEYYWLSLAAVRKTIDVPYNDNVKMREYLLNKDFYDTLALNVPSQSSTGNGDIITSYVAGINVNYVWQGIYYPYKYYTCKLDASGDLAANPWKIYESRITYDPTIPVNQYNAIYDLLHDVSDNIKPELIIHDSVNNTDKILTEFYRRATGTYEIYVWIDTDVSPNIEYKLANINGVKSWSTSTLTDKSNIIECTVNIASSTVTSSTTFNEAKSLYKTYGDLIISYTEQSQQNMNLFDCIMRLYRVKYDNSSHSNIEEFRWTSIKSGEPLATLKLDSNGWTYTTA